MNKKEIESREAHRTVPDLDDWIPNVEFDCRVVVGARGYDHIRLADMADRIKLPRKRRALEPLTVR
jgi:hypothetical protein